MAGDPTGLEGRHGSHYCALRMGKRVSFPHYPKLSVVGDLALRTSQRLRAATGARPAQLLTGSSAQGTLALLTNAAPRWAAMSIDIHREVLGRTGLGLCPLWRWRLSFVSAKESPLMSAARLLMLAGIVVVGLCSARPEALGAVPEQFMAWGGRAKANDRLGEPALEARPQVNVQATEEEAARGFLVFSEPSGAFIKPDYVPAAGEWAVELAAKDCAGQYGPVTFVVFALRGGEVGVTVSDLKGEGGVIPAENLDVRAVRYVSIGKGETAQTVPLLLEKFEGMKVAAGRLQQFWITYYIPKGTAPGTYEGQVGIRVDGQQKLALPLKLTVYPFDLVEPDVRFYIDSQTSNEPSDRELVRKELLDQRCHGMTVAELGAAVTDAGDLLPEVQAAMLDLYSEVAA